MTDDCLTFGDVFEFGDKEYVFLALTVDNLYAAKVFTVEDTRELDSVCNRKIVRNYPYTDSPLFCYIILTTEEIKDRAAQFGNPGLENCMDALRKLPISLNESDLKQLKDGILGTKSTPIALKEIVKDINLA